MARIPFAAALLATALTAPLSALPAAAAPADNNVRLMTVLSTPDDADGNMRATAINNHGTIVGGLGGQPTKWSSTGARTTLPLLTGYDSGAANDINDNGDVVGYMYDPDKSASAHIAVRWDRHGNISPLATNIDEDTEATAITEDGRTVLGWRKDKDSVKHSVKFIGNKAYDLLAPGDTGSVDAIASDTALSVTGRINDRGVKRSITSWQASEDSPLGALPPDSGVGSTGEAISRNGRVIAGHHGGEISRWNLITPATSHPFWHRKSLGLPGEYRLATVNNVSPDGSRIAVDGNAPHAVSHGYIYEDGQFTDLGEDTHVYDVNDYGVAVGRAYIAHVGYRPVRWAAL